MSIIEKYRKILEKPVPPPFDGYLLELVEHIEELLVAVKGNEATSGALNKPRKSYSGTKPNPLSGYEDTPLMGNDAR